MCQHERSFAKDQNNSKEIEKSPGMDSGSVPADYELENIQGLSGSTVYASNIIRNLHVRTNNIITGSQDQHQEAELEAMRQIVQGPAPPQFRSSFHEEQKGNTSPQHEGSAKQAVSRQVYYESSILSSFLKINLSEETNRVNSFPTVGLALSPDRSSSAVPGRNSLDLEAGNFSIDAPGAFHDNKPKVTLGSHKNGGKIEDKKWNPPLLDGFPKSAGFIVLEQDRGATIFRRFDEPAMRNLLYLQSRVAALTRRLKIYDAEDWTTNDHSARRRLEDLNGRIKKREDRLGFERQPGFKPSQDQVLEVSGLLDEILDIHGKGASASEGAILDISQRIADLEGCVRHADTPLKDLVDVNSPIPGNYRKEKGKEEEKQPRMFNGLKIRRQERSRMRISRLLCYIARTLEISPEVLLLYLLAWPGPDYDRYTQLSDSKKMEEFLCMASDPPLTQINDVITGLEVLLQNYLRRYLDTKIVPPAASVAAKSWEDFEMFGSAEKMRKRRLEWEDENPDKSWPFLGLSDAWIRKMQDRWNLALDLKEAIKEYRKWPWSHKKY